VSEIPDETSSTVFSKGILIGLKVMILAGGHLRPISHVGEILLCRYAQKNAAKNITSEVMNNSIPNFNPAIVSFQ